jgi:plasmid stabilization system protein ParE
VPSVRWTEQATLDLAEIVDYIDERNPVAAQALKNDIFAIAERHCGRPFLYRPGRVAGTREAVVRPTYLIVHQVGAEFVDLLRVLHTAREYP